MEFVAVLGLKYLLTNIPCDHESGNISFSLSVAFIDILYALYNSDHVVSCSIFIS